MSKNIIAEYVWLDAKNNFRSKARTFVGKGPENIEDIPDWNYDGSSTGQAEGNDSEITLKPCAYIKCPFRKGDNIIVLCGTFDKDDVPLQNNHRVKAKEIFDKDLSQEPWYGLEQEYFIIDSYTGKPYGFYNDVETERQGRYYCGVGYRSVFLRDFVNKHYNYCLYSGLTISGINAEVAPAQWEYQIGPVEGILAGDELLLSRYLLVRLAEEYKVGISFHPKPLPGDWNGSGCHTNFSTDLMRKGTQDKTGLQYIDEAIEKLSKKHREHMDVYGCDNKLRMTGEHETSSYNEFSFGRANRGASVRIPNVVIKENKGYFEDRRPSSNCNPYLVTSKIFETCCLE